MVHAFTKEDMEKQFMLLRELIFKKQTDLESERKKMIDSVNENNCLLKNLGKLHTTEMGAERIRRNLCIDALDVVKWCYDKIQNPIAVIERKGKNWYAIIDNCRITVNAHSYTIITAHELKQ